MSARPEVHECAAALEEAVRQRGSFAACLESDDVDSIEELRHSGMRADQAHDVLVYCGRSFEVARRLARAERAFEMELTEQAIETEGADAVACEALAVEAMSHVDSIRRMEIMELRTFRQPPRVLLLLAKPLYLLLHRDDTRAGRAEPAADCATLEEYRKLFGDATMFMQRVYRFSFDELRKTPRAVMDAVADLVNSEAFDNVDRVSRAGGSLCRWLQALVRLKAILTRQEERPDEARRAAERTQRLAEFRREWTHENVEWLHAVGWSGAVGMHAAGARVRV